MKIILFYSFFKKYFISLFFFFNIIIHLIKILINLLNFLIKYLVKELKDGIFNIKEKFLFFGIYKKYIDKNLLKIKDFKIVKNPKK